MAKNEILRAANRGYIAMVFLCRSEMAYKFTFFLYKMMPRGDTPPGQTIWSSVKFFTPLERSAQSPWEKLVKLSPFHLSPLVRRATGPALQ